MVLAHVMNRLCNVVNKLTVQVFKDDWVRTSAYQVIRESNIPPKPDSSIAMGSTLASKLTSGLPDSYLTTSKLDEPRNITLPPVGASNKTHSAQVLPVSQRNPFSTPGVLSDNAVSPNRYTPGLSNVTIPNMGSRSSSNLSQGSATALETSHDHNDHSHNGHSHDGHGHSHDGDGHGHSH